MNTYTATDAKRYFGQILNECLFGKKAVPVQRHGKIIAYVVPSEQWDEKGDVQKDKPLPLVADIYKWREKYKNKKRKAVDTVKMIKEIREERVDQILRAVKGG